MLILPKQDPFLWSKSSAVPPIWVREVDKREEARGSLEGLHVQEDESSRKPEAQNQNA